MIQKVLKVGSSAAVTIPKKSLKQLGINIGDEVMVDTHATSQEMTVRPIAKKTTLSAREKKMTKLAMDFIERYRDDLNSLADK